MFLVTGMLTKKKAHNLNREKIMHKHAFNDVPGKLNKDAVVHHAAKINRRQ